jgi:4-hydroxy-2-oxoheptanedioate aldolase
MTSLPELLTDAGPVIGTWSQIGAPEAIDILGSAGFQFTILDAEHGSFGMDSIECLARACDAAGILPIVRVPNGETTHITRALDAGARAVVVPGIRSARDAANAIQSALFAPDGARGACPCVRAGGHWISDWPRYQTACERDTGIIVLAETASAVEDIDAICGLERLKGLMVGPFDLAVALGHGGDSQHPDVVRAVHRMIEVAVARGVPVILPLFAPDLRDTQRLAAYWQAHGVRIFTIGTDKILLYSQSARFVDGVMGTRPMATLHDS